MCIVLCLCVCSEHALNCTKQCFNYLTMSITDVRVFARLLIIVCVHWDSKTVAYILAYGANIFIGLGKATDHVLQKRSN